LRRIRGLGHGDDGRDRNEVWRVIQEVVPGWDLAIGVLNLDQG
jgi:hypothetical protein